MSKWGCAQTACRALVLAKELREEVEFCHDDKLLAVVTYCNKKWTVNHKEPGRKWGEYVVLTFTLNQNNALHHLLWIRDMTLKNWTVTS